MQSNPPVSLDKSQQSLLDKIKDGTVIDMHLWEGASLRNPPMIEDIENPGPYMVNLLKSLPDAMANPVKLREYFEGIYKDHNGIRIVLKERDNAHLSEFAENIPNAFLDPQRKAKGGVLYWSDSPGTITVSITPLAKNREFIERAETMLRDEIRKDPTRGIARFKARLECVHERDFMSGEKTTRAQLFCGFFNETSKPPKKTVETALKTLMDAPDFGNSAMPGNMALEIIAKAIQAIPGLINQMDSDLNRYETPFEEVRPFLKARCDETIIDDVTGLMAQVGRFIGRPQGVSSSPAAPLFP